MQENTQKRDLWCLGIDTYNFTNTVILSGRYAGLTERNLPDAKAQMYLASNIDVLYCRPHPIDVQ